MANAEYLAILKQGVEKWNRWRERNPDIRLDFTGADLSRADLSGADLHGATFFRADLSGAMFFRAILRRADLSEADLSEAWLFRADLGGAVLRGANLLEADLSEAVLSEANLSGADIREADLSGADLSGADLSDADIYGADLSGAVLSGADLGNASVGGTLFVNVDLSKVKGLETVVHYWASTIGIDTLYKSQGKISEVFLRGCGVPEELITYLPSLISGKAIQYYSCFISYSSKDEEFAKRLHADLQARGVRVWFAPEDIKGGRKLHEQIPEAIRLYDKLLLVLSENSMQSEWVKTEIRHARKDEAREKRRKLFPISLVEFNKIGEWEAPDDTAKDMAVEVREYFIPDFSRWKEHDAYQEAFERLMRDLNLEGEGDDLSK